MNGDQFVEITTVLHLVVQVENVGHSDSHRNGEITLGLICV